jgi:general secretion pathway protein H
MRGFTLIELLVVVFVIGVLVTLSTLAVGDGGRRERLQATAHTVQLLTELGAQEAVLRSRPIALVLESERYYLAEYREQKWLPREDDPIYQIRTLPDGFEIVATDPKGQHAVNSRAPAVFLPDGSAELLPLTLRDRYTPNVAQLAIQGDSYVDTHASVRE